MKCLLLACTLLLGSCMSLEYDLDAVPIPVSAQSAPATANEVTPFQLKAKHILWVHGALGRSVPNVTEMIESVIDGHDRIAGLRITQSGGFHEWLATHLSLTTVRMKTVVIEGQLVRD